MQKEVYEVVFNTWSKPLLNLLQTEYFQKLVNFLNKAYASKIVYPNKLNIFKAFKLTTYNELKVVIIGKGPYSFNNMATGLAFANEDSIIGDEKLSPSLLKIKQCVEQNVYNGFKLNFDQTLESWAKQGVLLLNTSLSVENGKINSHYKYWVKFIIKTIETINDNNSGIIFLLWGEDAQNYEEYISLSKNYVLKFNHPSWAVENKIPWNCNHFTKANEIIKRNNGSEFCIEW